MTFSFKYAGFRVCVQFARWIQLFARGRPVVFGQRTCWFPGTQDPRHVWRYFGLSKTAQVVSDLQIPSRNHDFIWVNIDIHEVTI